MMLARVADSLYWIGRYAERAEHQARLASVMLNADLDDAVAAHQVAGIALAALGRREARAGVATAASARNLTFGGGREDDSVLLSIARARENARQVRDQITTETWERLNLLYLRISARAAPRAFAADAPAFLQEVIADLHLFTGAAEATMSHGEGWRFMLAGAGIERAQLMARLLRVCFGRGREAASLRGHEGLMSLLRMACALEPYLRAYTADIDPRHVLEFLLFDEAFPRSVRFAAARVEEHLAHLPQGDSGGGGGPLRLAGRLNARLAYADLDAVHHGGAGALLAEVSAECEAIHQALHEAYVVYPLETRLPA